MIKKDDRTPEQVKTHIWGVVARDKFLSGWGEADGGYSRCVWACHPEVNFSEVENWVNARSDMTYVSAIDLRTYRPPRGTAHFHIYVVNPGHPATGIKVADLYYGINEKTGEIRNEAGKVIPLKEFKSLMLLPVRDQPSVTGVLRRFMQFGYNFENLKKSYNWK